MSTAATQKIQLKHRIVHALLYEGILLVIGTPILSWVLGAGLGNTGVLWVMMSIAALLWNVVFNYGFERFEAMMHWQQRTIAIRVLHAFGVEGGILLLTVPMIAWMMALSFWDALLVDIGLASSIVVYTFIYQWCYDTVSERYFKLQR